MASATKKKAVGDHSPEAAPVSVINLSDNDDWSDGLEEPRKGKIKTECELPEGFLNPLRPTAASTFSKFPELTHKLENARWDEAEIHFLLKLLADYNVPQWRQNDVCMRGAWDKITQVFNKKYLYANVKKSQLQKKFSNLKKTYKVLKHLSETDGLCWDFKNDMLQGHEDVWQKLMLTNSDAKKWHKTPWPYYHIFQKLFEGRYVNAKKSTAIEDNHKRVNTSHHANLIQEFDDVGESVYSPPFAVPLRNPLHSSFKKKRLSQPHDEKDFTIKTCMDAFYRLDGFMKEDLFSVSNVFRSLENREIFMSLREEDRGIWIREVIDKI